MIYIFILVSQSEAACADQSEASHMTSGPGGGMSWSVLNAHNREEERGNT